MNRSETKKRADGRLKLLFVTSSLYFGGAQKVTWLLAEGLADRHDVTVAYCFDSGRSHPYGTKCVIRKLPEYSRDANLLKRIMSLRGQARALKEIKEELEIDAAVSLGNTANMINALSGGPGRIICCERSNPKRSWGALFFQMTRWAYLRADHVVFQSHQVRDLFGKSVRRKSSILKNPVLIPEPADERREKKVVNMGRLTAQKNQDLLIRAFARFHEQYPEYTLHIYGEGDLEDALRAQISALGMDGAVFIHKNDPDVHDRIRDAEMFVLSSDFEGLSNALLECMARGIACISTRCEGSVDVIRSGENGLLTEIGDERGLTKAMCTLAGDPELRRVMEREAMKEIAEYDRNIVTEDWERMIREVCL